MRGAPATGRGCHIYWTVGTEDPTVRRLVKRMDSQSAFVLRHCESGDALRGGVDVKPCTVTERIRFRRAEVGAWRALAPFHYLGGAPRGVSMVFSADYIPVRSYKRTGHCWRRLLAESQTAAVLVVS